MGKVELIAPSVLFNNFTSGTYFLDDSNNSPYNKNKQCHFNLPLREIWELSVYHSGANLLPQVTELSMLASPIHTTCSFSFNLHHLLVWILCWFAHIFGK